MEALVIVPMIILHTFSFNSQKDTKPEPELDESFDVSAAGSLVYS